MVIIILLFLALLNGFFALSEIALVSVNRNRIEHLADKGNSRAKIILKLLEKPHNFLSSVQVGITLIGIVAGAYGGVNLTNDFAVYLSKFTFLGEYTHTVALVIVIGSITYFNIVIGELVPKTIALNNAEPIALISSPIIKYFTIAVFPFVKLLSFSTQLILKLFGVKEKVKEHLNEEELKFLLLKARKHGILERDESRIHQNLFYFTDQTAKSLMTDVSKVEWLDLLFTTDQIASFIQKSIHSKFIVCEGQINNIKGIVTVKNFLENYQKEDFQLAKIVDPPIFISHTAQAFEILNLFKRRKQYLAVVKDDVDKMIGIVTIHDLMEAIIGRLPDEGENDHINIIPRSDGSYLIDGATPVFEVNQYFQKEIIKDNIELYTTVEGFIIENLEELPRTGKTIIYSPYHYEIVDMDDSRIDKVVLKRMDSKPMI